MSNWQQELIQGFSNAQDLLDFLEITSISGAENTFKTRVPRAFAERMQKGDDQDPLLLQVLATHQELDFVDGYSTDPLHEAEYNPSPGIIHKYYNRLLFVLTAACAVNCRYCFRRHFPYQDNNAGKKGWRGLRQYLQSHAEVEELILSGGDPLILNNRQFADFLENLADLGSLTTIRIHSRIPIVLPSRIDDVWLKLWDKFPWQKVMVVHCNHPQELDGSVHKVLLRLKQHGWIILNQAVLLKGVNDNVDILVSLSKKLFAFGVMPYYLNLLDKVHGAAHFEVDRNAALTIYKGIQNLLSGYLVPKLVQEIAGVGHKSLVLQNI